MSLVLLLGGARSGKSQLAVEFAARSDRNVVFVATAEAGDDEMRNRIVRHRADRPHDWQTIEAPRDLIGALAFVAPDDCVVVDCLSLWVANLLHIGEPTIEDLALTTATLATGDYQLVVLDEITYPINYGWVSRDAAIAAIRNRAPHVNVVATGRDAPAELIELADTVTEMVKVKHVYDRGIRARRGIDF